MLELRFHGKVLIVTAAGAPLNINSENVGTIRLVRRRHFINLSMALPFPLPLAVAGEEAGSCEIYLIKLDGSALEEALIGAVDNFDDK